MNSEAYEGDGGRPAYGGFECLFEEETFVDPDANLTEEERRQLCSQAEIEAELAAYSSQTLEQREGLGYVPRVWNDRTFWVGVDGSVELYETTCMGHWFRVAPRPDRLRADGTAVWALDFFAYGDWEPVISLVDHSALLGADRATLIAAMAILSDALEGAYAMGSVSHALYYRRCWEALRQEAPFWARLSEVPSE